MFRAPLSLRVAPAVIWLGFVQISFLTISILDSHWEVGTLSNGNYAWLGLWEGCIKTPDASYYVCSPAADWPADPSCSTPDAVSKGQTIIFGLAITATGLQLISTVMSMVGSIILEGKSALWNSIVVLVSFLSVGAHVGAAVATTSQFSCPLLPDDSHFGYAAILFFAGIPFGAIAVVAKIISAVQVCCVKPEDAYRVV